MKGPHGLRVDIAAHDTIMIPPAVDRGHGALAQIDVLIELKR